MSEIVKAIKMHFNGETVGKVFIWDDGVITAEFEENENGAACVAFLTTYALRVMLQSSGYIITEEAIHLN